MKCAYCRKVIKGMAITRVDMAFDFGATSNRYGAADLDENKAYCSMRHLLGAIREESKKICDMFGITW